MGRGLPAAAFAALPAALVRAASAAVRTTGAAASVPTASVGVLIRSAPAVVGSVGRVAGAGVQLSTAGTAALTAAAPHLLGGASPVRAVAGLAAAAAGQAVRTAGQMPAQTAAVATSVGRQTGDFARTVRRDAGPLSRALIDVHPERMRRRVWSGHGHAHIEVRGMSGTGPEHRRLAGRVQSRLGRLRGVRWAAVNAVTGQVLVAFDERRVDVGGLLDVVREVEEAHGTQEDGFAWSRPVHPSDPTPVTAAAVELAADCLSVATALVTRAARIPTTPRGVRVAQALLELERPLRRTLKRQIGPIGTDVVLALSAAVVQGFSQAPGAPAVDALYRLELLAEALSRRAVWDRREGELCCSAEALPGEAPQRPPRPHPRPLGPIERWAERLGPGALGAAGAVLAVTGDPRRAADTILVAVPKAARRGREGFATTVGRELANRGVVPLNAAAWRRLDRISAIVLDSPVLCSDRTQILAADPAHGVSVAEVWRAAGHALRERSIVDLSGADRWECGEVRLERDPDPADCGPDEPGAVRLEVRRGDRRLGRVTVGSELEPLADGLLDAARATGSRVLLTRHASVADVLPAADEVLDGESLMDGVLRLQAEGHGVLVVSGTADAALAAADVGVAVLDGGPCSCWSADLLCGPGLENVWRVLRVVGAARPVSERAVQLAQAGSALGTLLALVGGRRKGGSQAMLPVHTGTLAAIAQGTVAGLRVVREPTPAQFMHVPWHALDAADVLTRLDQLRADAGSAAVGGRPQDAVAAARALLADLARRRPVTDFLPAGRATLRLAGAVRDELRDPLTPVLAVGAAASAIVGSGVDALMVTAVLSGNAVVSGVQRVRAERALRRLFLEQEVVARRLPRRRQDAAEVDPAADADDLPLETVPATELIPGDIIALQASDVVPADARILSTVDLEVDESTLTGESVPVAKRSEPTPAAPLAERCCMVFSGTTVLAGAGYAVVVATGSATEAGRATRAAGRAAPRAGVQARLAQVTRTALPATGIGGAAVTGLALLRRLPLRQAVAAGVSVAVAAVPEGLPLVATVSQAASARRLSRRGVLVRSSRTLEALGRVDVVCFDKTGTLTEGRLRVARLAGPDRGLDGGDPAGEQLLRSAARACPQVPVGAVANVPHATDRAVLEAAAGLPERAGTRGADDWRLSAELPFETNRGYAASLGTEGGQPLLAVKGAPEVVLTLCREMDTGSGTRPLTGARQRSAARTVERLAADGLRVLAVAERRADLPADAGDVQELVTDLTLLGFVGVADTPRPVAAEAVRLLVDDGVRAVMVTGDHPATAAAIAGAVGIPAGAVLTGPELDRMTEGERTRRVAETTVFARVSPEQKARIVEAMQQAGRVVAMTGDGTNDAAAIRLADVGIGVAAIGSSSARSAADLVLADADVRRIHDALLEGRGLWQRVRDAVSILVGGNAGEVAFMVLGTAIAGRPPINVRQLLVVNMLTDMFPALAVAVSPGRDAAGGDAEKVGRDGVTGDGGTGDVGSRDGAGDVTAAALGAPLVRSVAVRGGATALGATIAWTAGRLTGRRRRASSMGLAALVATQLGQTLIAGRHSPVVVATTGLSAAALFALVETPGISQFCGCSPIGPLAWAIVLAAAAAGTLAAGLAPRLLPSS